MNGRNARAARRGASPAGERFLAQELFNLASDLPFRGPDLVPLQVVADAAGRTLTAEQTSRLLVTLALLSRAFAESLPVEQRTVLVEQFARITVDARLAETEWSLAREQGTR